MTERASEETDEHELVVVSDAEKIGTLRRRVGEIARNGGADDTLVADLELVVSELATNVMRHSDSPTISVMLRREPGRWVLDVADADGLDHLGPESPPGLDDLTGRGLFIVQAVMDDVEIIEDHGHRRLRCCKNVV